MSVKPLVKVENVSVIYDLGKPNETRALMDVNAEIYPEEYVVFFGPSGCGKSTLLYVIAGMQPPTRGRVLVDENDLGAVSDRKMAMFHQESMGMVFQQYNLIQSLSVIDNVALPQAFRSISRHERLPKAQTLLDRFGIGAFSKRLPTELSGGQQQRVSIARALINNTPLILADEPTGNLDSKSTQNVLDILQELNEKDKKTIILVTHDPNQLQYATRVFHMKDGRIVRETVNTQKKQIMTKDMRDAATREEGIRKTGIGPGMSATISDILAVYPELTETRLKSKAVVNYLLSDIDTPQIARIERLVEDLMLEKISKDEFHRMLDMDIEKGGAGLNFKTAKRIGDSVEALLMESETIQEDLVKSGETEDALKEAIGEVRDQLLDIITSSMDEGQVEKFSDIIKQRITGKIGRDMFFELLDKSFKDGGVGLRKDIAHDVTRRMEILLIKFKGFAE